MKNNKFDNVKKGKKSIDGNVINTLTKEIDGANILSITVGTNGEKGGDSGHGCRTYIKLKNICSTDITIKPILNDSYRRYDNKDDIESIQENSNGVEIILGGDSELGTIIEALDFAVETLKSQSNEYLYKPFIK